MNCKSAQALLSTFVDGELGREEMDLVSRHVKACCSCQKTVDAFAGLAESIRGGFGTLSAPEQLEVSVMAQIADMRQSLQTRRLFLVYVGCVMIGLFVVTWLVFSPVGHVMRAIFRLSYALMRGTLVWAPFIGTVWFIVLLALVVVLLGLAVTGVVRTVHKMQSEAVL